MKKLPPELQPIREAARRALLPVKPADASTRAEKNFLFSGKRTAAGAKLPDYYLVYFLLVDLLGFKDLGQFEKVAWSVPVDYQGQAFLIEHRKSGVGVFAQDLERDERAALEIVIRVQKAVKAARRFFDWLADEAVNASAVNVNNNSSELFERFKFLRYDRRTKLQEAEQRKDESDTRTERLPGGGKRTQVSLGAWRLRTEADWLALSAVEAFFSWTEHAFILVALLTNKIKSAQDVATLAKAQWADKFKAALDLSDKATKGHFDKLVDIRGELRNYIAHGAFGKQGEAFKFHSGAGAVPVLLPHRAGSRRFSLGPGLEFNTLSALQAIDEFIQFLWDGDRAPAKMYIESRLPLVLTLVANGTYRSAMRSVEDMQSFVEYQTRQWEDAANMDW